MTRAADREITRRIERVHAAPGRRAEHFGGGPLEPGSRLAVLPSAFNPPTEAHLALMTIAARALHARPAALLTTRNVSKGIEGASLEHRVGMLMAARSAAPDLVVLVANTARFVDQARALREHFPDVGTDFIAGYDTLVRLFDSSFYDDMDADLEEFFLRHRLVATNRGPNDLETVNRFLSVQAARYPGRIVSLEIPTHAAALSSTEARESASKGAIGVPEPVRRYIREMGLYGAG